MATMNFLDVGYSYGEGSCTGPIQHTHISRGQHGRFHPYTGRDSYSRRTLGDVSKPTFLPEPTYQPQYMNYFISPMTSYPDLSGTMMSAGSQLSQKMLFEDMFGLYSRTREPIDPQLPAPLQTLQEVCNPTMAPISSQHGGLAQSGDKTQSHPFYWRKRSEPASGMTRTRDKYRVVYTEKQKIGLEKAYKENKFITLKRKTELTKEIDLSARQIKIWFQNRRAKERRDLRKSSDSSEEENSIKDDNDIDTNTFVSPSTNFQSSCRFNDNNSGTEDVAFSTGQCRFTKNVAPVCVDMTSHGFTSGHVTSHCATSGDFISCGTAQTRSLTDNQELFRSRHSISPTEWNLAMNNTLNVSPLGVNMDFNLLQRL